MKPVHYATYFDRRYLARGLALYRSLLRHSAPFVLWVLCLDLETERTLAQLRFEQVRLIPLSELEQSDPELLAVRGGRSPLEYYWTCGPSLLLHLLSQKAEIGAITYLDADLFLYASPAPIYEELGGNSILIIENRGVDVPSDGRFNVGWLVFRRTPTALACLQRWREQCLDWCYDRAEENRFGDQAYLNDWPERYPHVTVLKHLGAGAAPWNIHSFPVKAHGGAVLIENDALICYHFSGLRRVNRFLYELHAWRYHERPLDPVVRRHIYAPYLRELCAAETTIRQARSQFHPDLRYADRYFSWGEKRRALRRGLARMKLAQYRRFMIVTGSWVV